jgi:hypothetical protein
MIRRGERKRARVELKPESTIANPPAPLTEVAIAPQFSITRRLLAPPIRHERCVPQLGCRTPSQCRLYRPKLVRAYCALIGGGR